MVTIGVPKEIKDGEKRAGLTPESVKAYTDREHKVLIEKSLGDEINIIDPLYANYGKAEIVKTAEEIYKRSDMIIKVKEPLPNEIEMLRENQILYTFLHLGADAEMTKKLVDKNVNCIAYESITSNYGGFPILKPMSQIAGLLSTEKGSEILRENLGKLLGGVTGVESSKVVVIGGGVVGYNAAKLAYAKGAEVYVLDNNMEAFRGFENLDRIQKIFSNYTTISEYVEKADLLIGGVLVPGRKAPKIITEEMIKKMNPGSVFVDVAIDQGGCSETSFPTKHSDPTYFKGNFVSHYCVPNMPGSAPFDATRALNGTTLNYGLQIADAIRNNNFGNLDKNILNGIVTYKGHLTDRNVAESHNMKHTPLEKILQR